MDTLLLTREDVHHIARHVGLDALMDTLIQRLAAAFTGFDAETTTIPARTGFTYTHPAEGLIEWMPCLRSGKQAVVKIVGYHPANARSNDLPTIVSTVSAYDTSTGHLQCLMDATFPTALRTGAASAIATRVLAVPEAETLGLIGAGAQAVTQLHALTRVLPIRRVLVSDVDGAVAASFADRIASLGSDLHVETVSSEEAVVGADVVCTATSVGVGAGPVFGDVEPRPWCHINAVGSDFPGKVEVPVALLERSLVCPDSRAQAVEEGECQQVSPDAIGPDLVTLLQHPERYADARTRLTVFDSTGWALEDYVTMEYFVEQAGLLGLGTRLSIEAVSGDALNPYDFASVPALQV